MTAYTRNMTQDATYWAPGPNDGFGGQLMLSPILIKCRWQDQAVLFRDTDGREVTSSAVVYVDRDLTAREYDFLNQMIGAGQLTVVRATPPLASYKELDGSILVTFAPNTPRYGDRGLLVEPLGTNISTGSASIVIGQNGWQAQGSITTTENAILAPDGTMTGALHIVDNFGRVFHNNTVPASVDTYVTSVFMKRVPGFNNIFKINEQGSGIVVEDGEPYVDGWYRHFVTNVSNGIDTNFQTFFSALSGSGEQRIYVWGFQFELGTVPSSYIPTVAAAVTRAADAIDIILPLGTTSVDFTFDDDSEQNIVAVAGLYTIPTNLNRPYIKAITVNYLDDAVKSRGYLALGDRTTIDDPRSLPDAYEIRSLQKSPHLSGNPILHKALL